MVDYFQTHVKVTGCIEPIRGAVINVDEYARVTISIENKGSVDVFDARLWLDTRYQGANGCLSIVDDDGELVSSRDVSVSIPSHDRAELTFKVKVSSDARETCGDRPVLWAGVRDWRSSARPERIAAQPGPCLTLATDIRGPADDPANAYLQEHVTFSGHIAADHGRAFSVGDDGWFTLHIQNEGTLDVCEACLLLSTGDGGDASQLGFDVPGAAQADEIAARVTVPAGRTETRRFRLKAISAGRERDIIAVHVSTWRPAPRSSPLKGPSDPCLVVRGSVSPIRLDRTGS